MGQPEKIAQEIKAGTKVRLCFPCFQEQREEMLKQGQPYDDGPLDKPKEGSKKEDDDDDGGPQYVKFAV
jgi:hypothetical protein